MIPVEAIELVPGGPRNGRWAARLDLLLRMLHAVTIAEHPYAYLVATEPRRPRPRT